MPWIESSGCVGCGVCVQVCPVKAISMNQNRIAQIDQRSCTKCGACLDICSAGIIKSNNKNPSLKGSGGGGYGMGGGR